MIKKSSSAKKKTTKKVPGAITALGTAMQSLSRAQDSVRCDLEDMGIGEGYIEEVLDQLDLMYEVFDKVRSLCTDLAGRKSLNSIVAAHIANVKKDLKYGSHE